MAEGTVEGTVEETVEKAAEGQVVPVPTVISQGQIVPVRRSPLPSFEQMRAQADVLVRSGFLPKDLDTPEKAMAVMLRGKELGLPPMLAISSLYPVKGKIQADSQTVLALILRSGQLEDISFEETEEKCTMTMKRKGIPSPYTTSWSKADDKRADLTRKDNYRKYPRDMHRAKCILRGGRALFPDIAGHLYGWEELSGEAPFGTLPSMTMGMGTRPQLTEGEVVEGKVIEGETQPAERPWDWMDFNMAAKEQLGRNPKEALYILGCSNISEATAKFESPQTAFTALKGALEGMDFKNRRDAILEMVSALYGMPISDPENDSLEDIGVVKYIDGLLELDPNLTLETFDVGELVIKEGPMEGELYGLTE